MQYLEAKSLGPLYELQASNGDHFWLAQRFLSVDHAPEARCDGTAPPPGCRALRRLLAGERITAHLDTRAVNGPYGAVYPGDVDLAGIDLAAILVRAGVVTLDHRQAPPPALMVEENNARCAGRGQWIDRAHDPIQQARCEADRRARIGGEGG